MLPVRPYSLKQKKRRNTHTHTRTKKSFVSFDSCSNSSVFFSFFSFHFDDICMTAVLYYTGAILYQKGYIDASLDVKTARYKKGGAIKWIGFFTSFFATCSLAYSMLTAQN